LFTLLVAAVSGFAVSAAHAQKVSIDDLSDVTFGTLSDLSIDAISAQNICVFSGSKTDGYNVTAVGGGAGGAFTLSSGGQSLGYEVQWNSGTGQSSGFQLAPNVPLTGQVAAGAKQSCKNGPISTATLIVVLRSAALSRTTAGAYSGTLSLTIAPE
jgi:spore coat protein U-like protein